MESIIKALSDIELKIAFEEYKELKNTGILVSDGIIRKTSKKCNEKMNNLSNFSITFIANLIMEEMAYRYYVTLF